MMQLLVTGGQSGEGYRFDGWYKDEACSKSFDFDKDTVSEDTTLYARWIALHTVTFESNGGSAVASQTIDHGAVATEPDTPTREGYTFDAWCSDKGLATAYDFSTPVEMDLTLYARWTKNPVPTTKVTLSYDANGGSGSMPVSTVDKGAAVKIAKNAFTREGYTFVSWNTKADGTGTAYAEADNVTLNEDVTLYAQWTPDTKPIVTPKPTMGTSAGGNIISRTTEVDFTVTQEVPGDATAMTIEVELDPALAFASKDVTVTLVNGSKVEADVSMSGQKLDVSVSDATGLRGQTVQVTYRAKVRDDADLTSYKNEAGNMALIPYEARTTFEGAATRTVSSDVEHLKVALSWPKPTPDPSPSNNTSTSTKPSLANTGDAAPYLLVAVAAVLGTALVVVGRKLLLNPLCLPPFRRGYSNDLLA